MNVGHAPKDAVGKMLIRVEQIIGLLCFDWLGCSLGWLILGSRDGRMK